MVLHTPLEVNIKGIRVICDEFITLLSILKFSVNKNYIAELYR